MFCLITQTQFYSFQKCSHLFFHLLQCIAFFYLMSIGRFWIFSTISSCWIIFSPAKEEGRSTQCSEQSFQHEKESESIELDRIANHPSLHRNQIFLQQLEIPACIVLNMPYLGNKIISRLIPDFWGLASFSVKFSGLR